MAGEQTLRAAAGRPGRYFYLSYAQSPPLAGSRDAGPDIWVRRLFHDLQVAVAGRASPGSGLAPGFFDQEIPLGADWKAVRTRELSAAQVFVPLYSPGYLARSLPGREWACFQHRAIAAGAEEPLQRFAPVLWVPLHRDREPPGLREAMTLAADVPDYTENGLRALLRLKPYRPSYQLVVERLAMRIVEIAEGMPLGPSAVPDVDAIESAFSTEAGTPVFVVAVAAPTLAALPDGVDPAGYGDHGTGWRPFPREQVLSIADHAVQIAEQFDFTVQVADIDAPGFVLGRRPGVLLIDPCLAARDEGLLALRSRISDLPPWVLPLVVLGAPGGTSSHADGVHAALADYAPAAQRLGSVGSLLEFTALMPMLVAQAERQYLRRGLYGTGLSEAARPGPRPRLAGSWPAASSATQPPREVPDA